MRLGSVPIRRSRFTWSAETRLHRYLTSIPDRQVADNMRLDDLPQRPRLTLLMRLLHQHYTQGVDEAINNAGFSDVRPAHAKVFPFVPDEGIQIGELAAMAGVRKQTMAQAVDELVRAGYAERRLNPRDARSRLVVLTERGRAVQPVAAAAGDSVEKHWAELTSAGEIEALRHQLVDLLERLAAENLAAGHPSLARGPSAL